MRLEQFFEKFELFADAPNAVAKLRELILHLAVEGRLVPQDPSDETADAMLERIASTAKRRGRDPDESERIAEPYQLPTNWAWVRLPRVLNKLTDGTHHSPANGPSGDFMYVTAKNIKTDGVQLGGITFVSKEVHDEIYSRCNPSFGDVLYIKDGATTGIATINQIKEPFSMLSSVALLKPSEAIFNRYLLWAMRSPFFYEETRGSMKGAAITRVTLSVMAASLLPLPPIAEQKRIVVKVDELMALCDRLEAQQQERDTRHAALARASLTRFAEAPTPANLDFLFHQSYAITPADLRKAILSLAVQGLLVPREPEFADWETRKLKDLTTKIGSGSTPAGGKNSYQEVGVPLIRSMNVHFGGFVDNGLVFLNAEQAEKLKSVAVKANDVLLNITGASIGRVATAPMGMEGARVNQHVCILRPTAEILARFLELFLAGPALQNLIDEIQVGATREALTKTMIEQFQIPVPSIAEQRRIVAKVDQLMAMVDQLEGQLSEAKAKSTALLDAVIHELLNPTAEIVDLAAYRSAMACYAIRKMATKPYFGRTAAMKLFYLAQAHVGLELDLRPLRDAAGPLDQWIYDFEKEGAREDWFRVAEGNIANGKKKIAYQPGRMLAAKCAQAERLLSASQRKEYDRLLSLFADRTTEEAEIITTMFAAWNDFLIDGHTPSDDQIVTEVREHWHEKKGRFTPTVLRQWLAWLRQNNLLPTGRLPHTVHQPQLLLN